MNERLHQLLHRLWTRSVGQEGYSKEEWKELERLIFELEAQVKDHKEENTNAISRYTR